MKFIFLVTILSVLTISNSAWSWGDLGHSAVGEIAERNLTKKGKEFVQSILGIEPLALAATWPDHVRDDARFKAFTPYHFWDMPAGFSSFTQLSEATQREEKDAHTIIGQAHKLLVGSKLSKKQKMILMLYFVHVVGDVHQPLHLGNPIDQGGNLCSVKLKGETKTMNLHSFWDTYIVESSKLTWGKTGYFTYNDLVGMILKDIPAPNEITGTPIEWYDETRKLLSVVYPDGKTPLAPEEREYCRRIDPTTRMRVDGKYDESKIKPLDDEYIAMALPIVKKQILLGGLRLASMLNKMGEQYKAHDYMDEKKIIDGVLIKNSSDRTPQSKSKK